MTILHLKKHLFITENARTNTWCTLHEALTNKPESQQGKCTPAHTRCPLLPKSSVDLLLRKCHTRACSPTTVHVSDTPPHHTHHTPCATGMHAAQMRLPPYPVA
mmetsp:Transcript_28888/g.74625  ORF Transcript_28888/g.74625 Transcript_28888/m.74625 type:complete len:104 (-) Transcript_28888:2623-2934(-)|eukprot:1154045-Pelagomonas_calceolata.AAC.4